jgi:hypothetical protein
MDTFKEVADILSGVIPDEHIVFTVGQGFRYSNLRISLKLVSISQEYLKQFQDKLKSVGFSVKGEECVIEIRGDDSAIEKIEKITSLLVLEVEKNGYKTKIEKINYR